ncbi:MAG: hypothetical protein HND48_04205 [Chloroflexi bacterium]|nr:hypothetical protein [Chloroflexota bacterium]
MIETDEYGRVALRGKTRHVEQVARVEVEADPNDPERQVKKTTIRLETDDDTLPARQRWHNGRDGRR